MVNKHDNDENFPPLNAIRRPRIPTRDAAYYMALRPQTLRSQFMRQSFDRRLDPIKVGRQIMWSVQGIKEILRLS